MSVISMIKTIKRVHEMDVVLVKIGEFYHAYGKDACILSYLFDYKLKNVDSSCYTCGFPVKSVSKIQAELERNQVNYVLLDRRNNYEVDEYSDSKKQNKYQEVLDKAYSYIKKKEKIDNIYNYLIMNLNERDIILKLNQIEEVLKND